MKEWLGHLSAAGKERILLARAPERLGAKKRVLVVVDGIVDVRGTPPSGGKAWGPREPLFALSPGEAFWDVAADREMDYALELTARDRARLIELTWEEMAASVTEPSGKAALGAMAESFLGKFGRWLAQSVPPRQIAPERAEGPGDQAFFCRLLSRLARGRGPLGPPEGGGRLPPWGGIGGGLAPFCRRRPLA